MLGNSVLINCTDNLSRTEGPMMQALFNNFDSKRDCEIYLEYQW